MYRLCSHIKGDGVVCQSPALTGAAFCYHHYRWQKRTPPKRDPVPPPTPQKNRALPFEFDDLDSPESIQIALSLVATAVANDTLDHNRASAILFAIQMATANRSRLNYAPLPEDQTKKNPRNWQDPPEMLDQVEDIRS